jgi:hypothetical protein
MPPGAGQREDRIAANFSERRKAEVRIAPVLCHLDRADRRGQAPIVEGSAGRGPSGSGLYNVAGRAFPIAPGAAFALPQPFVVERNICHFVWYSVVASEGLRSDGVDDLPPSKSGSSILPIACIDGPGSYGAPAFRFAAVLCPMRLRTGHRGQNLGLRLVHAQEAVIPLEHDVPSPAVLAR